jgi:dTDP-4-dehydrorhamnose 3,5-epimerase
MTKFKIENTTHPGIYIVKRLLFNDNRGALEKYYQKDIFDLYGFIASDIYTTVSNKNVVRGMHHQVGVHSQAKLISCTSGAFYDISIDLRVDSEFYGKTYYQLLKGGDHKSLLIMPGFSHGTYALENHSVMLSICSGPYLPEFEQGFNMKSLNLPFYNEQAIVSNKDLSYPNIF